MQQNEIVERINQLLSDEEYVNHLCSLGSAEAVSKELENNDIDISPDEIRRIIRLINKKVNGELSEEELADIAGGLGGMGYTDRIFI